MGISDSNNVPKLSADGSNFKKWKSAVIIYAQMHGALDVLTGDALEPPKPTKDGLLKPQEPLDISTLAYDNPEHVKLMIDRKVFDDNVRSNNKTIMEEHDCAHVELRLWQRLNAYLDMAFLQSLPADIWQAIDNHDTAAKKWQDILARFEEGGLTEACTAWADFFKLRCGDCTTTAKFTDKFRMCLNRLEDLSLGLPTAGVLYQFILAIEDTYPEYARSIRRDLRSNRKPTLNAVIKELNDESRREDPVKTAFASNNAARRQQQQ
jgi:hypothetical protein